jgi:hypothetical protein
MDLSKAIMWQLNGEGPFAYRIRRTRNSGGIITCLLQLFKYQPDLPFSKHIPHYFKAQTRMLAHVYLFPRRCSLARDGQISSFNPLGRCSVLGLHSCGLGHKLQQSK